MKGQLPQLKLVVSVARRFSFFLPSELCVTLQLYVGTDFLLLSLIAMMNCDEWI